MTPTTAGSRVGRPRYVGDRDVVLRAVEIVGGSRLNGALSAKAARQNHGDAWNHDLSLHGALPYFPLSTRNVQRNATATCRREGARSQGTSPCPQLARHCLHFPGKSRRVVPRRTNRSRTRRRVRSYCSSRGRSARRIPSSELGRRLAARASVAAKLWRQTRTQGAVRGGQLVEIGTWLAV